MYHVSFSPRWSVEYDYEYVRDCIVGGCDSICRCGRYENLWVTKAFPHIGSVTVQEFYEDARGVTRRQKYKFSTVERYCIDRLLRVFKAYDHTLYTANVEDGYYGEEIGSVSFDNSQQLISSIQGLIEIKSDLEKILYTLKAEYSFILPQLESMKVFSIEELELKRIELNDEYLYRLKKSQDQAYYFAEDIPVGVVLRKSDGGIKMIDGYHRYTALIPREHSAKYIVLSEE